MSPYLFVCCTKKLAKMIQMRVNDRSWHPVRLTRQGLVISHLVFPDDVLYVLLFCKATKFELKDVMEALASFCKMLDLKVSLERSRALCFPNINYGKNENI